MKCTNINFKEKEFFLKIFRDHVYLVGGTIRDFLLYDKPSLTKDIDLMVMDHTYEDIEKKLKPYGKTNTVGKNFAVVKFSMNKKVFDISIPRTDLKKDTSSFSHKNFIVNCGPHISLNDDLKRRDFTCNSIALNLSTNKLYDPFNGLSSIQEKIIHMTNPNTFIDDPLRILRCARFASVHHFQINKDIYDKVKLVSFADLSAERINEELILLLLNSQAPSIGLNEYFKLTVLKKIFPQLYKLTLTIQDSEFHPEKDSYGHHSVWGHTLLTVDIASKLARKFNHSAPLERIALVLAALFHDIGKPPTTDWQFKKNRMTITSVKHDSTGSRMTEKILTDLKIEKRDGYPLKETVVDLVKNHHRLFDLYQNKDKISFKTIAKIVKDLKGKDFLLLLLDQADRRSRFIQDPSRNDLDKISSWYLKKKEEWNINSETIQPMILGRDLQKIGIKPGRKMGSYLKTLYELQLDGKFSNKSEGIEIFKKTILKIQSP